MARPHRNFVPGGYYHVINRGNDRATVFHRSTDYHDFLTLVETAQERVPLALVAFCLMPNHFHFVLSPTAHGDVSRWVHWLLTTHTHRYHLPRGTSGRVWQGRFKAFPIEDDRHLFTVLRYVERNALRSGLVESAERWPWGSLSHRLGTSFGPKLARTPLALPRNWLQLVNEPQNATELEAIRASVNYQRPYGDEAWAATLDWRPPSGVTNRPRGRPPRIR